MNVIGFERDWIGTLSTVRTYNRSSVHKKSVVNI